MAVLASMAHGAEWHVDVGKDVIVVLPEQPAPWERTAACELADYWERTCGRRPVMVFEPASPDGQVIYVGATRHYAEAFADEPLNKLPPDTICI